MSTFSPLIPTGLVPLNEDYNNLRNNNSQLDISFGRNHAKFSDTTSANGRHTYVELNSALNFATNIQPFLINGYETIFAGVDTAPPGYGIGNLFFNRGAGTTPIQLTGGDGTVPSFSAGQGWTFLPGGFIIQFGTATLSIPPGTPTANITLPKTFLNNFISVTASVDGSNTQSCDVHIQSKSQFRIISTVSGGTVYWQAIGN